MSDHTKPYQVTTLDYTDLRTNISNLQGKLLERLNPETDAMMRDVIDFLRQLKADAWDGLSWVDPNAPKA